MVAKTVPYWIGSRHKCDQWKVNFKIMFCASICSLGEKMAQIDVYNKKFVFAMPELIILVVYRQTLKCQKIANIGPKVKHNPFGF